MRGVVLLLAAGLACTPRTPPAAAPRLTPGQLATGLAEADRLASRGCYLCLKEAAGAYAGLLALSDDAVLATRALENNLMIALREIELRMPDSGAREAADALQPRATASYAAYFDALDALAQPMATGGVTLQAIRQQREARLTLAAELAEGAHASAMRAYFYLSVAFEVQQLKDIQPDIDSLLAAYPDDLSLKYRVLGLGQLFSPEAARALIGMETGFGEVHFLLGQRAVMGGGLADGFRDLTRARELLPDSRAITSALAGVTFSYARYAEALALYDRILAADGHAGAAADPASSGSAEPGRDVLDALLGRARSLSYLKRHREAIAVLDDLLRRDPRNNPGEKYYWLAWNRLQLGESQPAYDTATAGLNVMRNDAIYRLAGIASFNLERLAESRGFFESALDMNRGDCDAQRYLGLLDSAERSWPRASGRFSQAVSCYDAVIQRLAKELAEHEKDITGLSNGLIAAKRAEIRDAEALRANSLNNAGVASKNSGPSP
jgi:tetratricopeptide (TPR) repeat protein